MPQELDANLCEIIGLHLIITILATHLYFVRFIQYTLYLTG